VVVKNKWVKAWMPAWFHCKVPLIRSPNSGRGKGVYALHSYKTELNFVMDPPFDCPEDEVNDAAFVKATTRTVSGRDAVEEYMACWLFLLSASFGLGEVADGETPVSKLSSPMPYFLVARLLGETNDRFRVRVELAASNVVGGYTHGEHKVCIEVLPN
jgi:hypothetical protein